MKKLILVTAVALALSACSTTKVSLDETSKDAVKYTQEFGKVEITFNDKGEWETLKSTGTSAIPLTDNAALEQAMNVATMRAKRNIVEFIQTDLNSSKSHEAITNALAKDVSSDENKTRERAGNIATKIQEKIAVEANGIVKGVYITDRKISNDKSMAVVTVEVSKKSMRAAQQVRNSFGS
jgi:2',3'-cyclic-nucleotide 2'-phosphodiesterase (5'-nucleotidase family)